MAVALPVNFRSGSPDRIVYDFQDLADGGGYAVLYGARDQSGYVLTKSSAYSDYIETTDATFTDAYVKRLDLDFDITINKAITLEGIGMFNIPLYPYGTGAGNTYDTYAVVKVRKVPSGGAEAEIANGTGTAFRWVVNSAGHYDAATGAIKHPAMSFIRVTIPATSYNMGDTLRVTIEVYVRYTGAGGWANYIVRMGHDPAGRNNFGGGSEWASTDITKMVCYLPIKIDL